MSARNTDTLGWARRTVVGISLSGVALGFVGFGQVDPDSSALDRLYASIQLLVLAGPSGLGSAEPLSSLVAWGRYLAAFGLVGAVVMYGIRVFREHADRRTARRARDHVVVFGSTVTAQRLALARRADVGRSGRTPVVLVGNLSRIELAALRSGGVKAVDRNDRNGLQSIVRDAAEVVVAEEDDVGAVEVMEFLVRELGRVQQSRDRVARVRALVHETSLARELRSQHAFSAHESLIVGAQSIVEAATERLADASWWSRKPPRADRHVVVVGRGEFARETAISIAERGSGSTGISALTLVPVGEDSWCASVVRRLAWSRVRLDQVETLSDDESTTVAIASVVSESEADPEVLIVGLTSAKALALAMRTANLVPSAEVIALVESEGLVLMDASHEGRNWRTTTLGELLGVPALATVDEELGREIRAGLVRLGALPGAAARLADVVEFSTRPPDEQESWAIGVAGRLRRDLAEAGLVVRVRDGGESPVALMTAPLIRILDSIVDSWEVAGFGRATPGVLSAVLTVLQDLPGMLYRRGFVLESTGSGNTPDVSLLSADAVEGIAQSIHGSYLAQLERAGHLDVPAGRPWDQLSEDLRESNRAQARNVPVKLLQLGMAVVDAGAPGAKLLELDDETVESMAWFEHVRWMYSRATDGWKFGFTRDEALRIHPMIVAYEDLLEENREKDRAAVRLLPTLLSSAGLAVRDVESRLQGGDVAGA